MNVGSVGPALTRLREWWLSPPRRGALRLIAPPEYRHLRAFGLVRVVGGIVAGSIAAACLSYAAVGWAAFFLVVAVLDLAVGYWELRIDRSIRR